MREAGRAVKSGRLGRWTLFLCLGLAMVYVIAPEPAMRSQAGAPPDIIDRPRPMPTDPSSSGEYDPTMIERRIRALNNERQKDLISDTNKLLKLAQELNDEITAKNAGTLTYDQLHKIAQIEKLARSVKEKMAEAVGEPTPTGPQSPGVFPRQ